MAVEEPAIQSHITVYYPVPLDFRVDANRIYPLLIINLGSGLSTISLHLMGNDISDIVAYLRTMRDLADEWLREYQARPVPVVMGSAAGSPEPDVREGVLRDEALREGWPEALAR